MFFHFFNLLANLVSIYSLLCVVRILFTWIPQAQQSKIGIFLCKITDPYLNIFRRIKYLVIRNIDFSPIIAIAALSLISSVLNTFASTKRIFFGRILASIIGMVWNLVQTIGIVLIILMIIRLIALLLSKSSNNIWYSVDITLRPITTFVANIFFKNKPISWKNLLIASTLFVIVVFIAFYYVAKLLITIFGSLPF